ncbi:MAG: lysylphosphatidylglycerol synthase transmembrane domain-containing protein [Acutalibacteraceae bacterium]|nr:lysylphosphatidylglycerol synthase transmembrane domain-containing protein [Acutalibacteraceae bacterium]
MKKKINFNLIFNIIVIVLSVTLITYFCISDDGLIDLINSDIKLSVFWIAMAVVCQLGNMFIDSVMTYLYVRKEHKEFTLLDGIKSSCVGSFFSAVTPSSTGGQPMQVLFMAKKNIDPGYSTSCLMQKFLVFQITSTLFSVFALVFRFNFFVNTITTPVLWVFVVAGFFSQVVVTGGFIFISFNKRLSSWIIKLLDKLLHKLKFIKNPDKYVKQLSEQVEMFHEGNKNLLKKPKLLVVSYALIFVQILLILLVPYCVYRGFSMSGASPVDMICSQAFVNLASAMMPLPGATGAAELAFSVFYNMFFGKAILKSALLVWRVITYYGVILICAPFSMLTKDKKSKNVSNNDNNNNNSNQNVA